MRLDHRVWGATVMAAAMLLAADAGRACSVPVYRYALERWQVDPYEVHVFHRGDLGEADKAALGRLRQASLQERPDGVLVLETTDLSKGEPEGPAADLWKAHAENAETPLVVVRYPRIFRIPIDSWSGPLGAEAVERLLDSPTRRKAAKRILEGETAVFIFLESGDAEKDAAARTLLEKHLKRMEELIEPPVPPGGVWDDPVYDTQGPPQLKIAFSIVAISRDDAVESAFLEMLLGCEPGLKEETGPMVFPVFGRGRVLCALVGEGISQINIEEVCGFIASPCSCIVKYQNPGVDMLMNVRWDAALMGEPSAIPEVKPPPLTGLAKFAEAAEAAKASEAAEVSQADEASADEAEGSSDVFGVKTLGKDEINVMPILFWAGLVVAALAIVAVASVVLWKRSKRAEA